MIQIEGLTKAYGDRVLFSEVSFNVGKGERCVLAGRNGSGKTTLLKIMAGLEEADEGRVSVPKGLRIGALPQHLKFTASNVLDEIGTEETWKAEIILSGLGFSDEDFEKAPSSFSGGYQLRIALAKVLVGEPDLLLLDEPTNYLDILAIRWLEEFLMDWQGQIVFVSHDTSFVNKVCTHVVGIKRGKVQKIKGDLTHYRNHVALQEETHERTREKLEKKKAHMESFVERFGAKASKASQAQARVKALEKMETMEALQNEQSLNFHFHYAKVHNKVIAKVEEVSFRYGAEPLIQDVAFEIGNGERLAIIGKNGSGKSTLLKLIAGELKPEKGAVNIGVNTRIAYFGQTNIDLLHPENTIESELSGAFPEAPHAAIRAACGAMLFSGDDVLKRISVLSGGERSRVLLAKILLQPSNLLLLDEPTHHLDVESVEALMQALDLFSGSVILVSHDEDALRQFRPQSLLVCHEKHQEHFLGDYDLFLEKRGWEEEGFKTTVKKGNKEERRERAEKVQELSAKLKPLKLKMDSLILKIEEGEKLKESLEEKLCRGEMEELERHGKLVKDLETHYADLEALMEEELKLKGDPC